MNHGGLYTKQKFPPSIGIGLSVAQTQTAIVGLGFVACRLIFVGHQKKKLGMRSKK